VATLYLACNDADYNAATGECSAPYYSEAPSLLPAITAWEGFQISFAIVGCWLVGLFARLLIRASQQETR
jgi:hypothetical protein